MSILSVCVSVVLLRENTRPLCPLLLLCLSLLDLPTPSFIIYTHSPVSWQLPSRKSNIANQSWLCEKLMTELLLNAKLHNHLFNIRPSVRLERCGESCASNLLDATLKPIPFHINCCSMFIGRTIRTSHEGRMKHSSLYKDSSFKSSHFTIKQLKFQPISIQ